VMAVPDPPSERPPHPTTSRGRAAIDTPRQPGRVRSGSTERHPGTIRISRLLAEPPA
jgi:hypothetical protein